MFIGNLDIFFGDVLLFVGLFAYFLFGCSSHILDENLFDIHISSIFSHSVACLSLC